MLRTWNCGVCTFKNAGDGFCVICQKGQPPQPLGKWACKRCTLMNDESNIKCVVCNNPKPNAQNRKMISTPKAVAANVHGTGINQNNRSNHLREPTDRNLSYKQRNDVEFYQNRGSKSHQMQMDDNQRQAGLNQQPMDMWEKPRRYRQNPIAGMSSEKSIQIYQKPKENDQWLEQTPVDRHEKSMKPIDINIELPSHVKPKVDSLITIENNNPKRHEPAKLLRPLQPPHPQETSNLLQPVQRRHVQSKRQSWSSEDEDQIMSQPSRSLSSIFTKPLRQISQQKPAQVELKKNSMDIDPLDDDVKYGDTAPPYSHNSYGQQSLSQAIAEGTGIIREAEKIDNLGTEELIKRLMQEEMCQLCSEKQGIEISGCGHKVCKSCGREKIEDGITMKKWASQAVTCPINGCRNILPKCVYRHFGLDNSNVLKLEEMQQKFNISQTEGLVRCPSGDCGYTFVGEPGKIVHNKIEKGRDDKPLSDVALRHKAKHRFRCPQCKCNFCGVCLAIPYHVGDTCESYKKWQESKRCRFCEATIDPRKIPHRPNGQFPGWNDVCHLEECQQRRNRSCGKVHKCGHPCIGIRNEKRCIPCFHPDCVPKDSKTHDDYCSICWTEGWSGAPCVQLECSHVVHYHCLMVKLEKKWPAARIVFRYLSCGECNKPIKNAEIRRTLQPHENLKIKVENMALDQLKREGFDKDKRLYEKGGKYYNNKPLFAMDRLAYYMCFKCKKPYFGGMRKCDAQDVDKWNEKHLVCGGCRMGSNKKSCKIHGTEFIVFKCKFCCSRGSWFCWGNTHFCDKCHKRQEGGDYLNRKQMSAHPKCPGIISGNPLDCPLKTKHPPNGTNFCLGCNICLIN